MMKTQFLNYIKAEFLHALILSLTSTSPFFIFAQEKDSLKSELHYSVKAEYGNLMNTNEYINSLSKKNYAAYTLQIVKQTKGQKDWERAYKNPRYGIGFTYTDFLENKQMGQPYAVYGLFEKPIIEKQKFYWDYFINLGVAFNLNPYNNKNNYPNVSFGSKTNLYIGAGSTFRYHIGNYFDLGLGLSVNHFSDGSLKSPNKGLNYFGSQLSLTYHPKEIRKETDTKKPIDNYEKFNTLELSIFGARKSVFYKGINREFLPSPYESIKYNIYGIEALYLSQYSFKSALGIGFGLTYDDNYNHTLQVIDGNLKDNNRFSKPNYLFSVMPSYRLLVGNFHVNIQVGYYPFKQKREFDNNRFFQKIGLQYQFSSGLQVSFGINAYDFHRANYLEWKIGYVLSRKVKK